ncbi:MAG: O-sialoglycoprotein endopeptidase [Firmicutes bacterium]|nr:O-sialoglycoprotein endopeptidase [Bacillota bacterium]
MILALDTSCYTTSLALLDDSGRLLIDKRRLLPVKQGVCGLRQSDALFKHLQILPDLVAEVISDLRDKPRLIAVATRPRPQENSYMPVFLAGAQTARLLSIAWSCPCWSFSHQEGHIAAALWSNSTIWRKPFIAAHLSGGTSELLLAIPQNFGYDLKILGGSDLPAGQFIDRVGVALGLPFPAGPALEQLALSAPPSSLKLRVSSKGANMSFSGPESAARRLIDQGVDKVQLAQAVFSNIAQSLSKALQAAAIAADCSQILITGGVAANTLIRAQIELENQGLKLHFANPAYAGDNAVGIGALAAAKLEQIKGGGGA